MGLDRVNRVIVGCWQLAQGHGRNVEDGSAVLEAHLQAGFEVFDCADIYSGVEELIGRFIAAHGLAADELRVHTKYVPDLAALGGLRAADVERAVDRSRARLGREVLDLVQFHWWDYSVPGYLEALDALTALQRQGAIKAIGLTNFDAERLREIAERGIDVASIQVQYSLLDRRPRGDFSAVAREHGIDLLAYGSVAGGLLSDAYLGRDDLGPEHENRSLTKYRLIVDEIGGWDALQALLRGLRAVADERGSDIASVAGAWTLQQPGVRACIVGVRSRRHVSRLAALRDAPPLDDAELARIAALRQRFPEVPGEVYALERDRQGRHGQVMKYGLNEGAPVAGGERRSFRLFDLRVEIVAVKPGLESVCNHHLGDYFELSGENLSIPAGKTFSMYALAAVLPLLPAKQRVTDEHDWMSHEDLVLCPDPNCEAIMRIVRTGVREFALEEVSASAHEAGRGRPIT